MALTRPCMSRSLQVCNRALSTEMAKVLNAPRDKMSDWAPTIITIKIDPEKIRDVIGKGGAVIRAITEETGTTIDIEGPSWRLAKHATRRKERATRAKDTAPNP